MRSARRKRVKEKNRGRERNSEERKKTHEIEIPSDFALWYKLLMNPSTACLEAVYRGAPGIPKNEAIDPSITMDLPP